MGCLLKDPENHINTKGVIWRKCCIQAAVFVEFL